MPHGQVAVAAVVKAAAGAVVVLSSGFDRVAQLRRAEAFRLGGRLAVHAHVAVARPIAAILRLAARGCDCVFFFPRLRIVVFAVRSRVLRLLSGLARWLGSMDVFLAFAVCNGTRSGDLGCGQVNFGWFGDGLAVFANHG